MALRPRATPSPVGHALELGVQIGGCVIIGLGIGILLDRWLGSSPWMMLLFLAFGFAAAVRTLLRFVSRSQPQQDDAAAVDERGSDG